MRNFKGRKTPQNIKNNVRLEPTSVYIVSTSPQIRETDTQEFINYHAEYSLPDTISYSRLSSIILPPEVTSITYGEITYYQSRKGAWKVKLSKFESTWGALAVQGVNLTLDRDIDENRLDDILIQFVVACRTTDIKN